MKLNARELGGRGLPVVILHGLFASSRNWVSAGKAMADWGQVFALDLRNHGDSPHADSHTLEDLVADLHEWLAERGLERPILVGHSMGGLAAMGYGLSDPQGLGGLVVVDIAPRSYRPDFRRELEALSIDISGFRSRGEIDEALKSIVPDEDVRQFLTMNAERRDGRFRWKLNVPALRASPFLNGPEFSIFDTTGESRSTAPALLVAGGESDFVRQEDIPLFRRFFPNGSVEVIPGCGHWLHFICSDRFQELVAGFLSGLS